MLRHAFEAEPMIADAAAADMRRFVEVDPATEGTLGVMLFFKGFQAVQCARAAHYFWTEANEEGRMIAKLLQSEMADVFGVDIHPGAVFGRGVTIDHATGVVIGETAVVGDDVYIMHDVRGRAAFWRSRRVASASTSLGLSRYSKNAENKRTHIHTIKYTSIAHMSVYRARLAARGGQTGQTARGRATRARI